VDLLTKNDDKVNVVSFNSRVQVVAVAAACSRPPKPMEIPKHTTPPPIPVTRFQ
jgi:hypothetical protein